MHKLGSRCRGVDDLARHCRNRVWYGHSVWRVYSPMIVRGRLPSKGNALSREQLAARQSVCMIRTCGGSLDEFPLVRGLPMRVVQIVARARRVFHKMRGHAIFGPIELKRARGRHPLRVYVRMKQVGLWCRCIQVCGILAPASAQCGHMQSLGRGAARQSRI